MPEVIGDDLTAFIKNAKLEGHLPEDVLTPYANTPRFNGTHIHGYDAMLKSILVDLTKDAEFDYSVRGGVVQLTVANGHGLAGAEAAAAATAPTTAAARTLGSYTVENVDFRRGEEGQSRVIVALDDPYNLRE